MIRKLNDIAAGRESEVGAVLLTRIGRPPIFWAENANTVRCMLVKNNTKMPPFKRGWSVMLPKGGLYQFPTKRSACAFIDTVTPEALAFRDFFNFLQSVVWS